MKYCHISFRSSFIIICVALAYLTYTPNLQATPPLPIPVQIYNLQDNTVSTPLIASIYEVLSDPTSQVASWLSRAVGNEPRLIITVKTEHFSEGMFSDKASLSINWSYIDSIGSIKQMETKDFEFRSGKMQTRANSCDFMLVTRDVVRRLIGMQ